MIKKVKKLKLPFLQLRKFHSDNFVKNFKWPFQSVATFWNGAFKTEFYSFLTNDWINVRSTTDLKHKKIYNYGQLTKWPVANCQEFKSDSETLSKFSNGLLETDFYSYTKKGRHRSWLKKRFFSFILSILYQIKNRLVHNIHNCMPVIYIYK